MWETPKRISTLKFKTLEKAKEKVLDRYPTALFLDFDGYTFIHVHGLNMGVIRCTTVKK